MGLKQEKFTGPDEFELSKGLSRADNSEPDWECPVRLGQVVLWGLLSQGLNNVFLDKKCYFKP